MDFLASQGFDFNKWVHSGVPFMRLSERDRCVRRALNVLDCYHNATALTCRSTCTHPR